MRARLRAPYDPLDVRCPEAGCGAGSAQVCVSVVHVTRRERRRPHAARVTAARTAERQVRAARAAAMTTDAWTCPVCSSCYRCPAGWEDGVWQAALVAAQLEHGERHGG